jgi:hypothetical protein
MDQDDINWHDALCFCWTRTEAGPSALCRELRDMAAAGRRVQVPSILLSHYSNPSLSREGYKYL